MPDIIKIMDIQQEQLARSLGEGHRVIHGVAGSGKTLILGYRCLDWYGQQIKTYHVDMVESDKPYWERQVDTVIRAVDKGQIPMPSSGDLPFVHSTRAQYGALLIDEGHDFEAEWLKLVTQMVDPETDSLLLLCDDAQSIYKKRSGLCFSLSSVGIRARGRMAILKANYRNTREILDFAYAFARDYIDPQSANDDHIPLIKPMAAGNNGRNRW